MQMTAEKKVRASLQNNYIEPVPVIPKIWVDFSANYTGTPFTEVLRDPLVALDVIADTGSSLGFDGVRQFPFPAKKIVENEGKLFEVDKKGKKLGTIDIQGGMSTQLFDNDYYNIEDPYIISHFQHWKTSEPVVNSKEDAEKIAVPEKDLFDELNWYANQKKVCDKYDNDMCYIQDLNSATMSFYIALRGMQQAMFDLVENPSLVHTVMEKGAQIAVSRGKYWLDKGFKVLRLNDSTGNLSLISAGYWKEYIYPYIKDICLQLHSYDDNALIYCHICGDVLGIAEDLVETGLDCIGPLDPLGGFSVKDFRRRVGDGISLMGGVNTLTLLEKNSDEVKRESHRCIKQAGNNSGYILGSGCVVPRDCPKENLAAMVQAAKDVK
jgi:hypothetical protein